jgi:sugar phosphate isomerase/epimerase
LGGAVFGTCGGKMIKQFGLPTLIETITLEACAALCQELRLDFVELNMNLPQYQADKIDIPMFAEIAANYGIYYTIHLDENLSPCDFNSAVAAAYTDTVLRTIGLAKRLGIPVLNMHMNSGVYFTLPDKKVYLFDEYEDVYLQKLTAFRDACERAVGDSGIKITVENCGDYQRFPFITEGLDVLLQSTAFALCFDIGHNASANYADEPIIMTRAVRLHHMHVHDAIGKSNHLPMGTGELDLARYLTLAQEHGCRCVLETKTIEGLRQSVAWLLERGAV